MRLSDSPVCRVIGCSGVSESSKNKNIERLDERPVETVEPDDRIFRFIMVIMPCPVGRQDEIAFFHEKLFAGHRGVGALPLHDEADRRHVMTMRFGDFARIDDGESDLQACVTSILSADAG